MPYYIKTFEKAVTKRSEFFEAQSAVVIPTMLCQWLLTKTSGVVLAFWSIRIQLRGCTIQWLYGQEADGCVAIV
jgi:hypothetical protein